MDKPEEKQMYVIMIKCIRQIHCAWLNVEEKQHSTYFTEDGFHGFSLNIPFVAFLSVYVGMCACTLRKYKWVITVRERVLVHLALVVYAHFSLDAHNNNTKDLANIGAFSLQQRQRAPNENLIVWLWSDKYCTTRKPTEILRKSKTNDKNMEI